MGRKQGGSGQAGEPNEPLAERLERAHRQIREFFGRELGDPEGELGQTRALLADLPAVLVKHFDDEERPGGVFEELRAIRPAVEPQLKFLRQEHRNILRAVEAIERRIEQAGQRGPDQDRQQHLARIKHDTAALLRMLRRHEESETRLVAELEYTEDGGSG